MPFKSNRNDEDANRDGAVTKLPIRDRDGGSNNLMNKRKGETILRVSTNVDLMHNAHKVQSELCLFRDGAIIRSKSTHTVIRFTTRVLEGVHKYIRLHHIDALIPWDAC